MNAQQKKYSMIHFYGEHLNDGLVNACFNVIQRIKEGVRLLASLADECAQHSQCSQGVLRGHGWMAAPWTPTHRRQVNRRPFSLHTHPWGWCFHGASWNQVDNANSTAASFPPLIPVSIGARLRPDLIFSFDNPTDLRLGTVAAFAISVCDNFVSFSLMTSIFCFKVRSTRFLLPLIVACVITMDAQISNDNFFVFCCSRIVGITWHWSTDYEERRNIVRFREICIQCGGRLTLN